jgi:hypothetical protein
MAARLETLVANERAPAFGALDGEVVGFGAQNRGIRVARTDQPNGRTHGIPLLELLMNIGPHGHLLVRLRVANEVHPVLCSAEQHVDAVLRAEEANLAFIVAADQGDDNYLGLLALEIVHGCQADGLQKLFLFNRLPRSGSGRLLLLGLCFKPLLREGLEVAVAEEDLEMLVEGGAELL